MSELLVPLIITFQRILDTVVELYIFVIIAAVVASWLLAFGVLNIHNQLARSLVNMLDALTDPVFRFVRRFLPPIGGLDLSPLVVLLVLQVGISLIDSYLAILVRHLVM